MVKLASHSDCTGCGACISACGKSAIQMSADKRGFLFPTILTESCVDCHACEKACPVLTQTEERMPQEVFAVKNRDEQVRNSCSSGGLFPVFADDVLDNGGVVYGAAFDSRFHVQHLRASTREEARRFRGSKYVQSDTGTCFKEVKKDLQDGRCVLFSGTPCQVAGLRQYLHKEYEHLTTLDFVCHGVPNPRIWEDYLTEEKASQKCIEDISFRDKSEGWRKFSFRITKKDSCSVNPVWSHPYMQLFLYDFIIRPSCFHCSFRKGKSGADFTMGDFWGIEHISPAFFDDRGVSLLITRNKALPERVRQQCELQKADYQQALNYNICLERDWPENPEETLFYRLHDLLGLNLKNSFRLARAVSKLRLFKERLFRYIKRSIYG